MRKVSEMNDGEWSVLDVPLAHTINDDSVTFHREKENPGNALSQLTAHLNGWLTRRIAAATPTAGQWAEMAANSQPPPEASKSQSNASWYISHEGRAIVRDKGKVLYDGPENEMPPDVRKVADEMSVPWGHPQAARLFGGASAPSPKCPWCNSNGETAFVRDIDGMKRPAMCWECGSMQFENDEPQQCVNKCRVIELERALADAERKLRAVEHRIDRHMRGEMP